MFKQRLTALVYGIFNLQDAETLCEEIHTEECLDYRLSLSEDRLWIELSRMIQKEYLRIHDNALMVIETW